MGRLQRHVGLVPILLQKSKVASVRIFGETLKREAIDDSDNLSRVTEVAYEFSLRRRGSSDLLHENRACGPQIFDTFGKTTFATLSANNRLMRRSNNVPIRKLRRRNLTKLETRRD
jgi:hypothetical protein